MQFIIAIAISFKTGLLTVDRNFTRYSCIVLLKNIKKKLIPTNLIGYLLTLKLGFNAVDKETLIFAYFNI